MELQKFINFKKEYVDNFFPKDVDTWKNRVLCMTINNEELMEDLTKYLNITNENTNAEKLDSLMTELREKSKKYFSEIKNEEDEDSKFNNIELGMLYYGLGETINELSAFSDELIELLKNKYKDNFLNVIEELDQVYLSEDTQKYIERKQTKLDLNDELLKKYLVMKKWQDMQHNYYLNVIEPNVYALEDSYEEKHPINVNIRDFSLYKLYYELSKKNLIHIDEAAVAYLAGLDTELVKLIGGKGYGLAKLRSNGLPIPNTYVLPVNHPLVNQEDLDKLDTDKKYAVRSSADIEDGQKNSFAGMFDSYLNVNHNEINENVTKVINSKNNNRLKKYIETNNLEEPNMSVVIQEFVEPEYAGVWIGNSATSGALEYVKGNGEKLVSGKVTPSREVWNENNQPENALRTKSGEIVGKLLLEYQNKVSKDGSVADFEWMILNGNLVMLQFRPVTSIIDLDVNDVNKPEFTKEGKQIMYGIPASSGTVEGPAKFVRRIKELDSWNDGDILMAWFTDPEWMEVMSKSSGIVTAVGGFLCHSAIIQENLEFLVL